MMVKLEFKEIYEDHSHVPGPVEEQIIELLGAEQFLQEDSSLS